jgi:septal ring factor EnvC (AmiA/AmiB activator)
MVRELEAAQKDLLDMIQKLRGRREAMKKELEKKIDVAFEKRQGKLPWPVQGKIVQPFGKIVHPVYKTVIFNTGIDIKATKGENVVCVAPGRVSYVGWMRGYGKLVVVEHGGNYLTIYTHLSEVDPGQDQDVQLGTILGRVGDTGSLEGAMLHFEVRRSSEPLDPAQWLEQQDSK